jgi:DNA polymerase-3 subunit beta
MKFSILQENLKQGLTAVSHVAGKNINLPILNNVMIEARGGNIKLISTNLEIGIVNIIRGKIEEEGAFTVDSKTFADYISLLPNKKINIEQKENAINIELEKYKTKLMGQSAEEFPLIPEVDRGLFYSAKIDDLKEALSQTVFAVSQSESRLELSGILLDFNSGGKKLTAAATDSYRLAEKTINIKSNMENAPDKRVIVPARTAQEVVRILANAPKNEEQETGDEIKFYISENQILFVFGATELVSRLIEGQYPDYKQIIPAQSKTKATINKQELTRAVKASALFSKTGINDINLDFPQGKNSAVVSSASGQAGESVIELDAEATGEDNGVVVNFRYLLDGLNNIQSENVKIEIIDSNTPCVLKPSSSAEASADKGKGDDYLYIIMPIKQ